MIKLPLSLSVLTGADFMNDREYGIVKSCI